MSTPDEMFGQLASQAARIGAMLEHHAEQARYEYRLVRWEKVNDLAREGWIVQQGLGVWNPEDGHVTVFLLIRPLTVADEADELLAGRRELHDRPV